ncbi:hypothetical protein rosag_47730 [Roseisolibacter agri]|uniref:Uncharacterized protein n=1 Tax=Roseisolibacter agri TaxID=2014610 RepID=A0AA37QKK5_9BACT|nr:hypothetical protein rosag_47730 [Roseisolibacter agri]
MFDNSAEVDPVTRTVATAPALFRLYQGRLTEVVQPDDVPPWAADLVTAAVAEHRARGGGMPVGWDLAPPGARRTRPRR